MGDVFSDIGLDKKWSWEKGHTLSFIWMWKASDMPFDDLVQSFLYPSIVNKEAMALFPTGFVSVYAPYFIL